MSNIRVKFDLNPISEILAKRHLERGGQAQVYVDNEVIKLSKPYIPFKDGQLEKSADASDIGSGLVVYKTPYAKKQFKHNKGKGKDGLKNGGMRGKNWTGRMKVDRLDEIADGVAKIIGGEVVK